MPHLSPFGVHSKIANSAFLPPGSQLLSPTKRLCRDNNNQHQGVNATVTTWEAKTPHLSFKGKSESLCTSSIKSHIIEFHNPVKQGLQRN